MVPSTHRPTRAIVDLRVISENIKQVQSQLPKGVETYAVVKADAYGHGAVAVANSIKDQVSGFCVSNLDEALQLRHAGIESPILILGVVLAQDIQIAIDHQITLAVASLEWVDLAINQELSGLTVHLKIDTGMGRIGFRRSEETNKAIHCLQAAGVRISGAFTHFATADEADERYFQGQLQTFKNHLDQLEYRPAMIHASNSATSLWHHDGIFNMVRLGVAIYGLNPSDGQLSLPLPLKPALSLTSELVHVKSLSAGQSIGYGATYTTRQDEVIGVVPIGYADGWTRDTQGFKVLIDGHACAIVGRISMDQLTVRLPKAYPIGTPVTLIGKNHELCVTATDVAAHRGTIGYEVLCLLSDRIPRIYR